MATKKPQTSNEELVKVGKMLVDLQQMGYTNRNRAIWFSFLKGIAAGAGAFIGGTVVIAILLWILGYFDTIPFVDHVVHSLQNSTNSTSP